MAGCNNISTFNCRGLREATNRAKIFEWMRGRNQDIIFMQETHSTKRDEEVWEREWGGKIVFSHGERNARGVMILIKKNLELDILDVDKDDSGRVLYVVVKLGSAHMLLVNIYAPNEDDAGFFDTIFQKISSFEEGNTVVGGDFNLVLDTSADKYGGRVRTNDNAQAMVRKHMDTLGLVDIWRVKHPNTKQYTWRRRKPSLIQCRLDFILISEELVNIVQESKIGSCFLSDHSIVSLSIKMDSIKRGPGYWKLNCALLKEREYVDRIKTVIRECEIQYEGTDIDPILLWETIKMTIRSASLQYSAEKRKKEREKEKELETRICELDQVGELSNMESEELEKCKIELNNILINRVQGSIIRSKCRIYEQDEKSSQYFLSLEKGRQGKHRTKWS